MSFARTLSNETDDIHLGSLNCMYLYDVLVCLLWHHGQGIRRSSRDNPNGITRGKRGGDLCMLESVVFS